MGLALLLGLTSCSTRKYLQNGDVALAAGDPVEALGQYERALALDPRRQLDPAFMAKLSQVRHEAAMVKARRATDAGRWDEAIAQLEAALKADPASEAARSGLGAVREQAARALYAAALQAADQGDAKEAKARLTQAIGYWPEHPEAKLALASVAEPLQQGATPEVLAAYSEGLRLLGEKRLDRAREKLAWVREQAPNHVPARLELYRVEQQLAQARQLRQDGLACAYRKEIEKAIQALEQAVAAWPYDSEAVAALDSERAKLAKVQELLAQAAPLSENRDWSAAIARVEAAAELYPTDAKVASTVKATHERAAAALVEDGRRQLRSNQPAAARQSFQLALRCVAENRDARDGLVDVDLALARQATAAERPGQAMLWYLDAAEADPGRSFSAELSRCREDVANRERQALILAVTDNSGKATRATGVLEELLRPKLTDKLAPGFGLIRSGQGACLQVRLAELVLNTDFARSQDAVKEYQQRQTQANPEIAKLKAAIAAAEPELEARVRSHEEAAAAAETGRKTPNRDAAQAAAQRQLDEREAAAAAERRQAEQALAELKRKLEQEPATAVVPVPAQWHYRIHTQRESISLTVLVYFPESLEVAQQPLVVHRELAVEDDFTENANPDIGVAVDPLVLPSDLEITDRVLSEATPEIAERVRETCLLARCAGLRREMQELLRVGRERDALEKGMAAVLLLEPVRAADSVALLSELRAQNRRQGNQP